MKVRAALFHGEPTLEVGAVDVGEIRDSDVRVRMQAVGVCGSDLHVIKGEWPRPTPMILGHEGAGVITELGPGVSGLATGQRVLVVWAPSCGRCVACAADAPTSCLEARAAIGRGEMLDGRTGFAARGEPVYRMTTVGALAEEVLLPASSVVPLPDAVQIDEAALLGCAALTGVGAVQNAARVARGDSVVVIGAGGVGLFVVQGARIAQAREVIVLDQEPERLALARRLGATATGAPEQLAQLLEARVPGGADHAIDAVGGAETANLAVDAARPGGQVTVVGLPAAGGRLDIDAFGLVTQQKTLVGSMSGSADPRAGLERLLKLLEEGALELQALVGAHYALDQVNEAISASLAGLPGRAIVRPS